MSRETLAQMRILSNFSPDPNRAERAMIYRLFCNVKLCKKIITKDLLKSLCKHRTGTNEVIECVRKLCRNGSERRINKMVCTIMKDKLKDSENEVRIARNDYKKATEEYRRHIQMNGVTDEGCKLAMRNEIEKTWTVGKKKSKSKIEFLLRRRKKENKEREPAGRNRKEMEAIKYTDQDLDDLEKQTDHANNNSPEVYGGAQISDKSEKVLTKEPGFMVYDRINETEMEVEIEKALSKARYELMNRGEDDEEDDISGRQNYSGGSRSNIEPNKVLEYRNLRATDIPTVPRLIEPKLGTISQEIIMENTKEKMLECVRKYKEEYCNRKDELKEDNLSMEERQGLKQMKREIKDKKVVVFSTDKSGKFSVDTPDNYIKAVQKHTAKDQRVTNEEEEKKVENLMNHHMRQFNKMFKVGSTYDHEDRVTGATISTNTPAPPMYGLRKDHKPHEDKTEGPPVRPVCGASESPNSRLSNFLSRVINDFADKINIETECRSSEQMKATLEQFNAEDQETKSKCQIISMDVKALYPSMRVEEVVTAVREMIEQSEDQPEGVDWYEVGKYLAVTMTKEEIKKEGLVNVIPERERGSNRKVTVAYLTNKQNESNWKPARTPRHVQKRKMIALAVSHGVEACMKNHLYKVGDQVYLQKEGGPIGLELTGAASRAFMWRWDRIYLKNARKAGINILKYERYVDDSNQIAVVPEKGAKYDASSKKVKVDDELKDLQEEEDERLARVLVDIANEVLPGITMEADWPSKNNDKRLPILDMKVWMSDQGNVMFTHYEKPMSNRAILNNKSAHPASCKRSVHTQEIIRRILNCSRELDWETETAPVISDYMLRMKKAGYEETYRKSVLTNAINIYVKKLEDEKNGIRPIHRNKNWQKDERRKAKENKRKNWATKRGHIAPIFVPATPGGELARRLRKIADREKKDGIHFNVMEVGGRTLKAELQRSNPTATPGCRKDDCLPCSNGRGKGGKCHKNNVNYMIECLDCPESRRPVYHGETSKNLYTRSLQHVSNRMQEESFMKKHEIEKHEGRKARYGAKVTHTNRDCMSRQIREGTMIRRSERPVLNSKAEWFQPPIYRVRNEIVQE